MAGLDSQGEEGSGAREGDTTVVYHMLTTKLYDRREMRHKAAQASRDSCTLSDHLPPLLRKDQLLVCYAVLRARRFQRDPCPSTHVDHVLTFCTTDSHPVAYYQLRY